MTISVRLPPDEERRLHELAAATGRSKSFYIRAALRAHLDHLEMAFSGDATLGSLPCAQPATAVQPATSAPHGDLPKHHDNKRHATQVHLPQRAENGLPHSASLPLLWPSTVTAPPATDGDDAPRWY